MALLTNYVTLVEDRPVISAKYSRLISKSTFFAIYGHFDISTYLEKWKSGLFKNGRAMVIFHDKGNRPEKWNWSEKRSGRL